MEKASFYLQKLWVYFRILWIESIYSIVNIIFICFLNDLNKKLLALYPKEEWFKILTYDGSKALYFFYMTVVLIIIGILIGGYRFKMIKNKELDFEEICLYIFSIILVIFWLITLVIFINNPILRAIILASIFICACYFAKS